MLVDSDRIVINVSITRNCDRAGDNRQVGLRRVGMRGGISDGANAKRIACTDRDRELVGIELECVRKDIRVDAEKRTHQRQGN